MGCSAAINPLHGLQFFIDCRIAANLWWYLHEDVTACARILASPWQFTCWPFYPPRIASAQIYSCARWAIHSCTLHVDKTLVEERVNAHPHICKSLVLANCESLAFDMGLRIHSQVQLVKVMSEVGGSETNREIVPFRVFLLCLARLFHDAKDTQVAKCLALIRFLLGLAHCC